MKVTKTESQGSGVYIDPGEYPAVIIGVSEDFSEQFKNATYKWVIKVKDATADGEPVEADENGLVESFFWSGQKWTTHPNNKLNQLLEALGFSKDIGEELDLEEDCVGKKFRVIFKDKKTEKGKYAKVSGFLPLKKKPKSDEKKSEEKPKEKPKAEKKEEKSSSSDDDDLFNFSD